MCIVKYIILSKEHCTQYIRRIQNVGKLLLLILLASGCNSQSDFLATTKYYYLSPGEDLTTIGRVAVIELDNDSSYPKISSDITEELFQALQKKQIFGLTIVRQNEPSWRGLQLEPYSTYTLDQIKSIREALQCDCILIGTITEFSPYPHTSVGLRLKLLDLRDGRLLWALEQVWDSTDKTIEYRTIKYIKRQRSTDSTSLNEQLVVVSPLEFFKFVSYEIAETL